MPDTIMTDTVLSYIGLGCNLGDRMTTMASAVRALENHHQCSNVVVSSFYETDPMGPQDQPDYLNAVASLRTELGAHALLEALQSIELGHGRERDGTRWGARTLDLDLLMFGDSVISTPTLTVPHPGVAERSFVLLPLSELAPDLIIPQYGSVTELLSRCRQFGIRRLDSTV